MHWAGLQVCGPSFLRRDPRCPPPPGEGTEGPCSRPEPPKDKGELGLEPSSLVDWATLTAYMETPSRN